MQFNDLFLDDALLSSITRSGFSSATEVQQQAIPALFSGQDVLACAATGTGHHLDPRERRLSYKN